MHRSTTPSLSETIWPSWASRQFLSLPVVQTLLPVTFGYSLSSRKTLEAVAMRQLRRWNRLWRRSLTRSHMRISRNCWNDTTSALQPEEITSKGTSSMCVLSLKVPIQKCLETYWRSLVCRIYTCLVIKRFFLMSFCWAFVGFWITKHYIRSPNGTHLA